MHRTEGEDYVVEGGKRRFINANPPIQKATRLPAEFMNAVQEEICNVISAATPAIPLNDTAAEDRTNGWTQLLQALQQGHLILGNSFASTALMDGLKVATGAENIPNTRTEIEDLRSALPFGFDNVFVYFKDPSPDAAEMKRISLAALAQAFGGERVIVVSDPAQTTLDLSLGETFSEAWDSNLTIIIAAGYTNTTLTITGDTPTNSRVTIVNAGWVASSDTESSYGSITWLTANLSGFQLRNGYRAVMHFADTGGRLDLNQIPPHNVPATGTPAFWSRLHGIRTMKTVDVETPITTPAVGNPTYPTPLLVLDQTSTNAGGTEGAGVRVAGDAGVEIPMASMSRLPNSRKRKTSRIFHSLDGELIWHKGTDAGGNPRGYVRLDNPVETVLRHYRTYNNPIPANGNSISLFSLIGDTTRFNLTPFVNRCANSKAIVLFSDLAIPDGETVTMQLIMRRWLCDGSNSSLDILSQEVVVSTIAGGVDVLRSIEFPFGAVLFTPGMAIEPLVKIIARTGVGAKTIGGIATALEFVRISE